MPAVPAQAGELRLRFAQLLDRAGVIMPVSEQLGQVGDALFKRQQVVANVDAASRRSIEYNFRSRLIAGPSSDGSSVGVLAATS
jgi:hypothetical protein